MPRCLANTTQGTQCRNKTLSRFPFCWIHLKSKDGLVVKKSTVPHSGLGLFYVGKKNFPAKKVITHYSGDVLTTKPKTDNDYALEVRNNLYIDAKKKYTAAGRYINHSSKRSNVSFSKGRVTKPYHGQPSISIFTKKVIKPNTELFANYGREYWKGRAKPN